MTYSEDRSTLAAQALEAEARSTVSPKDIQDVRIEEKRDVAHAEDQGETDHKARDVVYDAQEDENKPRTGLRRVLKRNPSLEFVREVADMDQYELDPVEVKHVERKLFWLIVPALCTDYIFYYVDKTTLSYAAIFGIKEDLHLEKTDYSTLSSIFYVGWLVWALPGNLLMPKFPLAKYLAVNIFLWGVFLLGQGGAQDFETMVALRVLSGAAEAVAKPGFMAITAMFFTRVQQPIIMGAWYGSQGVGIGLGGLIGYGIGQIKGSLPPWRFEFLIIGAACSLWAIIMGVLIPDSPYTSRWFTRREKLVIVSRKRADYHGIEKRQLKWDQVWETAKDVRTYLFFLLGLTANIPNGGTSNFGTLMTKGFGFNTLQTTLLQIPYGATQTLFIAVTIYINHKTLKYNVRTYVMAVVACFPVFGFAMMAYGTNQATKLIGYYFTGASNAVFSLALSLVTANTGGTTKKMLISATIFVGVAVGNIVGPYAFLDREAPKYITGIIVCMISRIAEIIVILMLRVAFVRPNKQRDQRFAEGDSEYDPKTVVYEDLSDKQNKHFRYIT